MWHVILKGLGGKPIATMKTVAAPCLKDAEKIAFEQASIELGSKDLVMIHRDDLNYDVYEVGDPICTVHIHAN